MTITSFKRFDIISLAIILVIAAFMRFGRAGIVEYFHDDGMLATMAQEMANGQAFHLTGILSSTGIPNPPTSVYALLPFFWISRDPVFAIYGIMALNVLGVGLLWIIGHRYFGRLTGIVAGLAYAVSPWAVLYSRKLWAQDYHTPFFLLALLLALYGFLEGESRPLFRSSRFWAQVFSLPILLFAMQIHFAAWALFPLYLILLWIGRKRIAWKTFGLSVLLSVVVLLPYGIGLFQTLQADPTRISDAAHRTQERTEPFTIKALTYAVLLQGGDGLEEWVAPAQQQDFQIVADAVRGAHDYTDTLTRFILIGLFCLFAFFGPGKHPLRFLLLWWVFAPPLVLTLNLTPVYPHYFVAALPAYALLFGYGVQFFFEGTRSAISDLKGWKKWGLLSLLLFLMLFPINAIVSQIQAWNRALDYLDTHYIPYPGFTTPLHYLTDIREALKDETDVVVLSDGMAWDLNHEVSVWDTLLYDKACVRTLRGDGYAVLPDHPFAVLVASNAQAGRVMDFYSVGTPQVFPERPGGGEYKVYQWETAAEWPVTSKSITPTRFANGVELIGYDLGNPTVTLTWRLPQGQRGENAQYTVQFFDAEGNRIGQGDKVFWQSQHWCEEDTLLTWLDIPRDAGVELATFRVGLYELVGEGQYRPIPAVDGAGQPIGDTVELVP